MPSLMDRLLKASTIEYTAPITESKIWGKKDLIPTPIPLLNVALSARLDGGLSPGLTIIAGESKRFKTKFGWLLAESFQRKYPDGVIMFYDSEGGTPPAYIEGLREGSIMHCPVLDLEALRTDLTHQLKNVLKRGDHVFILLDSFGSLASLKEISDAEKGRESADITRAKTTKSICRIVTPLLNTIEIPMVGIGHVYQTINPRGARFSKKVVSGGTGLYLHSNTIWMIDRRNDEEKTDKKEENDGPEEGEAYYNPSRVKGYHFIIKAEKSRFVREGTKYPISVSWDKGINKWSGMFELALDIGFIEGGAGGWYYLTSDDPLNRKKFHAKDVAESEEFWNKIINETDFGEQVYQRYRFTSTSGMEPVEQS